MRRIVLAIGIIFGISGCVSPRYFSDKTIDVTNNPAWWGELSKGEVLQLRQDTLLDYRVLTFSAYKITDNYDSTVIYGGNVSVEKFKANPNKYWPELHLLPMGTQLRCVRLLRVFSPEYSRYTVWAEILNGEFQGKVVDLGGFATGNAHVKGTLRLETRYLTPMR